MIDSGAVIHGGAAQLFSSANQFWTVPEVLAEIRDKKARHLLDTLPYEIKLKTPSEESLAHVAGFARKTGDLRSLSKVDLQVIALTYELEKQETGAAHINAAPVVQQTARAPPVRSTAPPNSTQTTTEQPSVGSQNDVGSDGACTSGPATDDDQQHDELAFAQETLAISDSDAEHEIHHDLPADGADGVGVDQHDSHEQTESELEYSDEDSTEELAAAGVELREPAESEEFSMTADDFPSLGGPSTSATDTTDSSTNASDAPKQAWAATAFANKDVQFRHSDHVSDVRTANKVRPQLEETQPEQADSSVQQTVRQRDGTSRILNQTSNMGMTATGEEVSVYTVAEYCARYSGLAVQYAAEHTQVYYRMKA